jgi:hypothetical protein
LGDPIKVQKLLPATFIEGEMEMSNEKLQAFLSRLGAKGKAHPKLEEKIQSAFRIVDTFAGGVRDIAKNPALTDQGKRNETRKLLANGYVGWLAKLNDDLKPPRQHVAKLRADILPKVADRTDVVAELQRAEVRTNVRSLPLAERTALVFSANLDPTIAEALMTAPPMLSGLPEDRHAHFVRAHLAKHHAAELAEIEHIENQIEVVDAAIKTARNDIFFASGLDDTEFRQVVTAAPSKPVGGLKEPLPKTRLTA